MKETIIQQAAEPTVLVQSKEYDGVVLTEAMVERWDAMTDLLARLLKQLEDLERRMMLQEERKMPAPTVVKSDSPKEPLELPPDTSE